MYGQPWAETQAALAGAEASWAVTAAGNYQQYVSQLGLAEIAYEATNTAQFVDEMKTIDAADDTAGNAVADADKTLTVTAAGGEVTLEDTLAAAGHQYQHDLGQAAHDYRQAVAQAEHDLAVGLIGPGDATAQETHDNAVAAAEAAKTAAENAADQTFADTVQPVISQTGTDEAEANFTDAQTGDGANYTDITGNNAAVDGYDDAESAAYDQEQQADATALDAMQVANATGHAAAIAAWAANFTVSPGFDSSGNPLPAVSSPWAQQAADQASADATQQISLAAAQLTQSVSQAQLQDQQEQSQADALETKDNGDALAEQTKADGDAASQETTDEAKAVLPSAVFDYLPDRLVPPSDGPAPVLTADYWLGYEANDFWQNPTWNFYGHPSGALSLSFEYFPVAPPDVMPDLPAPYWAYEWQGYGHNMPWGLLGPGYSAFDPSQYASPDVNQVIGGASGGVYGNGNVLWVRDVMRDDAPDRLTTVYQSPTHFSGTDASLLEVSNTPSFIGDWSTTPAPLPTLTDAQTDSAPPSPSRAPDFAGQEAPGAAPPSPTRSEGSPSPSNQQTAAAAGATAAAATGPGGVANAALTLTLYVMFLQPDPAAEEPEVKDRANGETSASTDSTQTHLANPVGGVQGKRNGIYGPPAPIDQSADDRAATLNALVQQFYVNVLVEPLQKALQDDTEYKWLLLRLGGDGDGSVLDTQSPAQPRSREQQLAIELGFFYNTIQSSMDAVSAAIKNRVGDTYRLEQIRSNLFDLRESVKAAYSALGLNDVQIYARTPGSWQTASGTGFEVATRAANLLVTRYGEGIEATGDEMLIADVAVLAYKGMLGVGQTIGRQVMIRLAAAFAGEAASSVAPAAASAIAPTVTQIMQHLVADAVGDLAKNAKLLADTMGKGALRRVAKNPELAEAEFGKAVETLVAKRIEQNPALKELFIRVKQRGPDGRYRSIFDFAGIGRGQGLIFDVTTRKDLVGHAGRWYSDLVEFITYDFPVGLQFPKP